jgi:hypothetical protein
MVKTIFDGCLLIRRETRESLKAIAAKNQTYDDIIRELISLKQQNPKEVKLTA